MLKVYIRPLKISDALTSYKWRNDPEIWKFTGRSPDKMISLEMETDWLETILNEKDSKRFAIIVDDVYVGNIQITNINIHLKTAQYHIFIGDKNYWKKGVATLATYQLLNFAFYQLHLSLIYLLVKPENHAAIKLYEKSGFQKMNSEIRMELKIEDMPPPMISVFMITYNHEKYIAQALESILMQKANFTYDIVVGEDCSTDKTRTILLNYAEKYPGKFKLLLSKQNIGAVANQNATLKECNGKYVALLEGDDFWSDPLKLQHQLNFLEENKDFSICYHPVKILKKDKLIDDYLTRKVNEVTDIFELAKGNFIHTPSVVFRKAWTTLPEWFYNCSVGDYALHMLNAQFGKIKRLNRVMGVYRIHSDNSWVNQSNENMELKILSYLKVMIGNFPHDVNKLLINRYISIIVNIIKNKYNINEKDCAFFYLEDLIKTYPSYMIEKYLIKNDVPESQSLKKVIKIIIQYFIK